MSFKRLFSKDQLVLTSCLVLLLPVQACDEEEEVDANDTPIVVTQALEGYDFASARTYALPDQVAIIKKPDENSSVNLQASTEDAILRQVQTNLDARGYRRIAGAGEGQPDIVVELAVMATVETAVYYDYWYPTWGYYYDDWYGITTGYVPTPVPYVATAELGSLIVNVTDPKRPNPGNQQIPTVWAGVSVGVLDGTSESDRSVRVLEDINQMFNQSPYFSNAGR